jgi:hypothetical protein
MSVFSGSTWMTFQHSSESSSGFLGFGRGLDAWLVLGKAVSLIVVQTNNESQLLLNDNSGA